MKKKFCSILLSLAIILVGSNISFANENALSEDNYLYFGDESDSTNEITPYINKSFTLELKKIEWKHVVSDRNILDANVKIVNDADSAGEVEIKIYNADGVNILSSKKLKPGNSTTVKISTSEKGYTVEARAVSVAGTYIIKVRD